MGQNVPFMGQFCPSPCPITLYYIWVTHFFGESLCYFVPFMGQFCPSPCPIMLYYIWVTHFFGESLCYFVPLSHSIIWYIHFEMYTIHQSISRRQTKMSHYLICTYSNKGQKLIINTAIAGRPTSYNFAPCWLHKFRFTNNKNALNDIFLFTITSTNYQLQTISTHSLNDHGCIYFICTTCTNSVTHCCQIREI